MSPAPRQKVVTVGLLGLVGLVAFEAMAVSTVMPTVARSLDGLTLYALAFAAPLASSIPGMAAAGTWSDRSGPRRPLLAGLVLFALGLAAEGLAPTMGFFVAGRVVHGVGAGLLTVASYAVVGRVYAPEDHPRIFAAFAAAWVLPALAGPPVAAWLLTALSWRAVFLVVPVLAVAAAWPVLVAVPASRRSGMTLDRRRTQWAVAAGAAVLLLHLAGHERGRGLLVALPALVVLAGAVRILLPRGTVRSAPGLPTAVALRGCIAAAAAAAETFLPLMLVRERGWSPGLAGGVLTISALGWSAASAVQGKVAHRVRPESALRAGFSLLLLGIVGALVTTLDGVPAATVCLAWLAAGAGMGTVFPTLSVVTLRLSAPEEQGSDGASLQLADSLSAALVLAVCGPVFAVLLTHQGAVAYRVCFAIAGLIAVTGLLLTRRLQADAVDSARQEELSRRDSAARPIAGSAIASRRGSGTDTRPASTS